MRLKLERFFAIDALLLLGFSGCKDVPERWEITPVKVEISGAGATFWQSGNYYIAGQPSLEGLAAARGRGVRTVINLRPPDEPASYDEKRAAEGLGLAYVSIPVTSQAVDDSRIDELLAALKRVKKPVLIHCASGDRAAALWAAHLGASYGMAADRAIELAEPSGLSSEELKAAVKGYLERRKEALVGAAAPGKQTNR